MADGNCDILALAGWRDGDIEMSNSMRKRFYRVWIMLRKVLFVDSAYPSPLLHAGLDVALVYTRATSSPRFAVDELVSVLWTTDVSDAMQAMVSRFSDMCAYYGLRAENLDAVLSVLDDVVRCCAEQLAELVFGTPDYVKCKKHLSLRRAARRARILPTEAAAVAAQPRADGLVQKRRRIEYGERACGGLRQTQPGGVRSGGVVCRALGS